MCQLCKSLREKSCRLHLKVTMNRKSIVARTNTIIKAVSDSREYRGIILENELKVLLISDSDTNISGASLSLQAGQMCDPKNLSGLSHLCEHVLMHASKKYPDINSFQDFLAAHGGKYNTYTFSAMTKFYFEVAAEKLEDGLDRFAQVFIEPLFSESSVMHEIKVVNSEFERNLYDDNLRIRQLNKHFVDPQHPYKSLGSGNTLTLETIPRKMNINVRKELITFFNTWYSSNIMCLVILGKEPLNKLEEWAVTKFSAIENKKLDHHDWNHEPYLPEDYAIKIYVTPVKDFRSLILSFTTADLVPSFRSRPENYVVHLLEHRGNGGILNELRNRHWCYRLHASHLKIPRAFGFLEITISLTEEGLEHINDIILLVFEYIKLIKEEGPKKWIHDELANMHDLAFKYSERDSLRSYLTHVANAMQLYPFDEVLIASSLSIEWRPDLIKEVLDALTPSKCRIFVIAKKYEPTTYDIEPVFKTKFRKETIPPNVVNAWRDCKRNNLFYLPERNPYLPSDFKIFPKEATRSEFPSITYDSPYLRAWYLQDVATNRPITHVHVDICNPVTSHDALMSNLTHMFVFIFLDDIHEIQFNAQLAGIDLKIIAQYTGIRILLVGYTHKLFSLLQTIVKKLFEFKVSQKGFELFHEKRVRDLNNSLAEQPFTHSLNCLQVLLLQRSYPIALYEDVMKSTTLEDFENFLSNYFKRVHVEFFVFGNINKQYVAEYTTFFKQILGTTNSINTPFMIPQLLPPRDFKLDEGESYEFDFFTKYSNRCCTLLYIQCGRQKKSKAALTSLLAHIMEHPCREYLRTKDLVGSGVKCCEWNTRNSIGICIIAQSEKDPALIEEQIEHFLVLMLDNLKSTSDEKFEKFKKSFHLKATSLPKTSLQKFQTFSHQISSALYHFNKAEQELNALDSIKKQQLLDFYSTHIQKGSPHRSSVFVYVYSPNVKTKKRQNDQRHSDTYADLFSYVSIHEQHHQKILSVEMFKASLELYPLTEPFDNVRYKGKQAKLNLT